MKLLVNFVKKGFLENVYSNCCHMDSEKEISRRKICCFGSYSTGFVDSEQYCGMHRCGRK